MTLVAAISSRGSFVSSMFLQYLLLAFLLQLLGRTTATALHDDDVPYTTLNDGSKFPLIGLGVGNLKHELIRDRIMEAVQDDKKLVLFDTAHASKNEKLVREGIKNGLKKSKKDKSVHVVTKVWYTHLGYERTKLSVKESVSHLKHSNIKVHILLHWPRCMDEVPWMNCEQEEENLPSAVKKAGPAPHLSKDTAFIESWRALEDIYLGKVQLGKNLPKVASIGVSNFALDDFKALEATQRVTPKILQGNIWSYLFDPFLMDYVQKKKIHFQAYNVINGAFYERRNEDAPNAAEALDDVTQQLSERGRGNYTLPQVVLKWLVQNHVSIIPRTSSPERLETNSAVAIAAIPELSEHESAAIRNSISALLSKKDLKPPLAQFINLSGEDTSLFWLNLETGEEILLKENLGPGERYDASTQSGHKFVAHYANSNTRKELIVDAKHGQRQRFDLTGDDGEDEL